MKDVLKSTSELRFGSIPYGVGGPVDLRPDNSKLVTLGWKPEVELKTGIQKLK